MSQSDEAILKEFLVELGFKLDEQGFKKFIGTIGITNKLIEGVAVGAFAAAAAVTTFAAKMTQGQAQLHFANQLAGTSAGNMSAFTFAAQKAGVALETAKSAVQGFGLALQTDPGKGAFLRHLGIDPNQDPTKVLEDYIKLPMNKVMRSAADAQLGLNDSVILSLVNNREQFTQAIDEYEKKLQGLGINLDQVQQDAAAINSEWLDIQANIKLASDAFYAKLVAPLSRILGYIDKVTGNAAAALAAPDNTIDPGINDPNGGIGTVNPDIADDVKRIIRLGENGRNGQISPAGALGIMQVKPDTAKEVAHRIGIEYDENKLRNDPKYNELIGAAYLNMLKNKYHDTTLAFAAYNGGMGRVDSWLQQFGDPRTGEIGYDDWVAKIPKAETRRYVERTIGYRGTAEDEAYNRRFLGVDQAGYASRFKVLNQGLGASNVMPSTDAMLLPSQTVNDNHSQITNNYNQTNNFNITGGSPHEIADRISSEMKSRGNGDPIRYGSTGPR